MANKKNQHFLPQFYFKNFSLNKKTINLVLRKSGKIIKNAPIRGQCSKNYFYGNIEIEEIFSQIEGKHSTILKKIIAINSAEEFIAYKNDFDPIKHQDIAINPEMLTLLQIILFQKSRTEYEAKKISTSMATMAKKLLVSHLEAEGEIELLKYKDYFNIEADETYTVLMFIDIAFSSVPAILDLGIYILKNQTEQEFIFSDSPVVFYNQAYRDIKGIGVLGLQSPGLLIFFPISPNTCLLLIDEQKYKGDLLGNNYFEIKNKFDVDTINKLQLHNSLNSIYFDSATEKYIRTIWRQQKNNFASVLGQSEHMNSFDQHGHKRGEILHIYEDQLPLEMKLSFLNSIDLSGERVVRTHRNKELINIIKYKP